MRSEHYLFTLGWIKYSYFTLELPQVINGRKTLLGVLTKPQQLTAAPRLANLTGL